MKVKVGQLKAHLSKYLREVQETGQPIEVCVREKPVAYLTPIRSEQKSESGLPPELIERLRASGLSFTPAKRPKENWIPKPGKPGDGLEISNTIVAMREEKDW